MMQRLLLELGPCLLGGLWLGQRFPKLPERVAPALMGWGVPLSLVGLLLKAGLQPGSAQTALLTLLITSGGLLLTRTVPWLKALLPQRSLQMGAVVGNTAYVGLPVAIALLPASALAFSITYDLVGTLVTWSLGPALLQSPRPQVSLWRLLQANPVCRALVVALPLASTPWGPAIGLALWWPARLVLWLMLLLVGMRLGLLQRTIHAGGRRGLAGLSAAVLIKLLLLPALVLLVSRLLAMPSLLRDAVVLQAAAPTAMAVLLLAEASDGQETIPAARLVLWSTLLSLLSLPLWWSLLSRI